jgi:hypothetical protein
MKIHIKIMGAEFLYEGKGDNYCKDHKFSSEDKTARENLDNDISRFYAFITPTDVKQFKEEPTDEAATAAAIAADTQPPAAEVKIIPGTINDKAPFASMFAAALKCDTQDETQTNESGGNYLTLLSVADTRKCLHDEPLDATPKAMQAVVIGDFMGRPLLHWGMNDQEPDRLWIAHN